MAPRAVLSAACAYDLPTAVAGQVIDLMNKSCVSLIADAIMEAEDKLKHRVGLAIFDPWSKGIAAGGGDENNVPGF